MFSIRSASGETRLFAGRPSHLGFSSGLSSFLLAAALLCSVTPAKAEYRLHAGDVIEISVARLPELKQRAPVQVDGTISYPLLGTVSVVDLSTAELQAKTAFILYAPGNGSLDHQPPPVAGRTCRGKVDGA